MCILMGAPGFWMAVTASNTMGVSCSAMVGCTLVPRLVLAMACWAMLG